MKKILMIAILGAFSCTFAATSSFRLFSPDFSENQMMPENGSCQSDGVSPTLTWEGEPVGTKSFTLLVTDPDAKRKSGQAYEHWVVYNLPSNIHTIQSGERNLQQGVNSSGRKEFASLCPPDGMHHYEFVLYALDSDTIRYPENPNTAQAKQAMKGHILAQASLVGTFSLEK